MRAHSCGSPRLMSRIFFTTWLSPVLCLASMTDYELQSEMNSFLPWVGFGPSNRKKCRALVSQRIWREFPAPISSSSQPPVTQEDPTPLWAPAFHTHTDNIYIIKSNKKSLKNKNWKKKYFWFDLVFETMSHYVTLAVLELTCLSSQLQTQDLLASASAGATSKVRKQPSGMISPVLPSQSISQDSNPAC